MPFLNMLLNMVLTSGNFFYVLLCASLLLLLSSHSWLVILFYYYFFLNYHLNFNLITPHYSNDYTSVCLVHFGSSKSTIVAWYQLIPAMALFLNWLIWNITCTKLPDFVVFQWWCCCVLSCCWNVLLITMRKPRSDLHSGKAISGVSFLSYPKKMTAVYRKCTV